MHPKLEKNNHISLLSPVQLDKTDQVMGTVFRKQIMSYGRWVNPDYWWDDELWMELTEDIADQFIDNFNKKTFGKRISVPLNHTGDVTANAGEVIKLEKGADGLYAYLDIRRPETVADIENGLIFDVSMGFDWNYTDQKEGVSHGATLIHVALVTDPYLNNMDDFQETDKSKLSLAFDKFAAPLTAGFGNTNKSIIMMSKANVEELRMKKLAKITNDQEHEVEVKYKDADGKEQTATVKPGDEIEVPETEKEAVETQISESEAPDTGNDDDGLTDAERQAAAKKEADDKAAAEADDDKDTGDDKDAPATGDEDEDTELSRVRARNAELEAEAAYSKLLGLGKIVPAQKELFMAFAKAGANQELSLTSSVKGSDGKVQFSKDKSTSVVAMLSAILSAGPKTIKLGEQGSGKGEGEGEVELTAEQEAKVKRMGFNVETFKKQLKAGTIKLTDIEEEK